MKRMLLVAVAVLMVVTAAAQELPVFSKTNYEGWTYTRPATITELNNTNISQGRINLYYDAEKQLAYTLLSPMFPVDSKTDSIIAIVTYRTHNYAQKGFVLKKTALTLATIDAEGYSRDSVEVTPTVKQLDHTLRLAVPHRKYVDKERIRLAGWKADVDNCGAVLKVVIETVSNFDRYNVNGDAAVDVGDVNALLTGILAGAANALHDLNGDGSVDVGDVNVLLEYILSH